MRFRPLRACAPFARRTILALLTIGTPSLVAAQTLRGRVVRSDGSGVAGALVVAVRDGRDSLRTVTGAGGTFNLTSASGGRVQLTVFRIGFRPSVGPTIELTAGETREVRLVATDDAVQLPAVSAVRERACRTRTEGGAEVAAVWEEARKALELSVLASEAGPLVGQWLEHRGTLAPDLNVVRDQSIRLREQFTQQVFRSVPPRDLAARGFIAEDGDTLAFFAPDQRVLLSNEFASTHCFALEGATGDSLIGIAFTPREPPARGRADIAGVIWVTRRDAHLRKVEFAYVGVVDRAEPAQRSGEVRFALLADGRWVVTGWRARLPLFSVRPSRDVPGRARGARNDTLVRGVIESGGDALALTSASQTLFRQSAPMARVQLATGADGPMVDGAQLLVVGTNVVGTVNALDGVIDVGPLPAGRYAASLRLPAYDTLGIEPLGLTIRASLTPVVDTLALPPISSLLGRLCGPDADRGILLRGTVLNGAGERVRGARVLVSYLRTDPRRIKQGGFEVKAETAKTSSDVLGEWRLCGVPRGTDLVLAIDAPDGSTIRDRFRIDPARLVARRDVVLATAADAASSAAGTAIEGPAPVAATTENIALGGRTAIDEFDSRHARGEATQSLTRTQILSRRAVQTWQIIAGLRGVQILQSPGGVYARSSRGNLPSMRTLGAACPYIVVLDGIRVIPRGSDGVDLNELPPPERLHGIELYAGGTRLPAMYTALAGGSFCGVIGVWWER
jgi:hypothetical protein